MCSTRKWIRRVLGLYKRRKIMYNSSWVNIFNIIKIGEKENILINDDTERPMRKNAGLSGYTIGLRYILGYYHRPVETPEAMENQQALREFAKRYINFNMIPSGITLPISPKQNYTFYFPYYESDIIENGSYPVAPIKNEDNDGLPGNDETVLTFPPNITLVFEPGAFLKLGGTLFSIENADSQGALPPLENYRITTADVNQQRSILQENEFLWIDIQGTVQAPKKQIFKVWDIETTDFSDQPEPLNALGKQITWVKALGAIRGPAGNVELYPQWWGASGEDFSSLVHHGQYNLSPTTAFETGGVPEGFENNMLQNFSKTTVTPDQLAIQSCIDSSIEHQKIIFEGRFTVHRLNLKPNRTYWGYGATLRRPSQINVQQYFNNISRASFTNSQRAYLVNLIHVNLLNHIDGGIDINSDKPFKIRNRNTLESPFQVLHGLPRETFGSLNLYESGFSDTMDIPNIYLHRLSKESSKQLVKNYNFIAVGSLENAINASFNLVDNNDINENNRKHRYGVSIPTRVKDLISVLNMHFTSHNVDDQGNELPENPTRHLSELAMANVTISQLSTDSSNIDSILIEMIQKYKQHLYYHKNIQRPPLPVSYVEPLEDRMVRQNFYNNDTNLYSSFPELQQHHFIGWRPGLSSSSMFNIENIDENNFYVHLEGFILDGNLQNQGIYDGFELEQNSLIRFYNNRQLNLTSQELENLDLLETLKIRAVVKNCKLLQSTGDGITIGRNINVNIDGCFSSDCWRGAWAIGGGFNTVFCNNMIIEDRNLKLQHNLNVNDVNQLYSSPVYSGIESENVRNEDAWGWTGDGRMNLMGSNIYMSGSFDFTFDQQSRVLLQNTISNNGPWNMYLRNNSASTINQTQIYLSDSIYTTNEEFGIEGDRITIEELGLISMDQVCMQGKNNYIKHKLSNPDNDPNGNRWNGLMIQRRYREREPNRSPYNGMSHYQCQLFVQHCRFDAYQYNRSTDHKVGVLFRSTINGGPDSIQSNESLFILNHLAFPSSVDYGVAWMDVQRNSYNFPATSASFFPNDYVKINKSYFQSLRSVSLLHQSFASRHIDPNFYVILNALQFSTSSESSDNAEEGVGNIILLQHSEPIQNFNLYATSMVYQTMYDIIFDTDFNFGRFVGISNRVLYINNNLLISTQNTSDSVPMLPAFQGDVVYHSNYDIFDGTDEVLAFVCTLSGQSIGEDNSVSQNAMWRPFLKMRS